MKNLFTPIKYLARIAALSVVLALYACSSGGGDSGGGGGDGGGGGGGGDPTPTPQTVGADGGTLDFGDVQINARQGALIGDIDITVTDEGSPPGVPTGFVRIGDGIEVAIGAGQYESVNGPLSISVSYDDSTIADENDLLVLHYDSNTSKYQPVRILGLDTQNNTIEFETRSFSTFVLVAIDAVLPGAFSTGFLPSTDGWAIANFGSYFSPGGNCLGMSGYGTWYFSEVSSGSLNTRYTADIAKIVALRAHLAQSQSWAISDWRALQVLSESYIGRAMKAYLALSDQPLILTLGTDGRPRHASIVYAYDETNFYFYDVNFPGVQQQVSFNGTTFGNYSAYNDFGFVGIPSLGRTEDFADLSAEADSGFTSSSDIQLTSPTAGQEVNAHQTQMQGTLSGSLNSDIQLRAQIKGVDQTVAVNAGVFNTTIPVSHGSNSIVLIAGVPIAQQSNWFKNSAALIRDFEGTLLSSAMLVTLNWDQDGTDVDLYVSDPNGATSWYGGHNTASGLSLDFDDTSGLGPEHITLVNDPTLFLAGQYDVRVHYYSDHGTGLGASGSVTIVINEGQPGQILETFPFSIATSDPGSAGPGGTGPTWTSIASVDVMNGVIL